MRMLIQLIIFFNLSLSLAHAFDKTGNAWLRKDIKSKLKLQTVTLTQLTSLERVEGEFFKVVAGTSEEAIAFNDTLYKDKATHVYYHATLAREYFLKTFPGEFVKSLPQVVIRIEMVNNFSDASHWLKTTLNEIDNSQFNNALSIPSSIDETRHPNVKPWGPEIWFRPGKVVELDNGVYLTAEALQDQEIKQAFYMSIAQSTAVQIAQSLGHNYWNVSQVNFSSHLATLAISLGVVEILPRLVGYTAKHIKRKVFIDTIMFPEIIYHEFSHIAFSDRLPLDNFNPVIEGFANYFAGLMTGHHKIMYRGGKHSHGLMGKNAHKKLSYDYSLELPVMAQSSFTFKLLNELKNKLGVTVFNQLLIQASTHKNLHENIKYNLINALFESIDELGFVEKNSLKFQIHQVIRELNV